MYVLQARASDTYEEASMFVHGDVSLPGRGSCKNLDRDQETDLCRLWQGGDRKAGERLVCASWAFVVSIATEYRRWGIPIEDLAQQGTIGFLRAATKFDPSKACRLTTYAAYWIRAEIREYVVRTFRVVRLGTTKSERRALRTYRVTGETDPEVLAAASGLSVTRVSVLLPLFRSREASLDSEGDASVPFADRLADAAPTPEAEATRHEAALRAGGLINEALMELPARERRIVQERLMSDTPTTLDALGRALGVSKERVRQLEERARSKLRISLAALQDAAEVTTDLAYS